MDPQAIKKMGLSTIPADATEPTFSEKAGSEGADEDMDKVEQPDDVKGAKSVKAQATSADKTNKKRVLLQKAAQNAGQLSDADLRRIGQALSS